MQAENGVKEEVYRIADAYQLALWLVRELAEGRGLQWWYERAPVEGSKQLCLQGPAGEIEAMLEGAWPAVKMLMITGMDLLLAALTMCGAKPSDELSDLVNGIRDDARSGPPESESRRWWQLEEGAVAPRKRLRGPGL